jgi:hypothetical protein
MHTKDAQWGPRNAIFSASFIPTFLVFGVLCRKFPLKTLLFCGTVVAIPHSPATGICCFPPVFTGCRGTSLTSRPFGSARWIFTPVRLAPHRTPGNRIRQGDLRHHSSQAAQDRSARSRERPSYQSRHGLGLSGSPGLGARGHPSYWRGTPAAHLTRVAATHRKRGLPFLHEATRVTVFQICESGEEGGAQEHRSPLLICAYTASWSPAVRIRTALHRFRRALWTTGPGSSNW